MELAQDVASFMVEKVRTEQTFINNLRDAERNKLSDKLARKLHAKKQIEELVRKIQIGPVSDVIEEEQPGEVNNTAA